MFTSSSQRHSSKTHSHSRHRDDYDRPRAHHSKSSPTLGSSAWVRPASNSHGQTHRTRSPSFSTRSVGGSSYGHTRARPRSGFISRIVRRIQRYLREIFRYMRRHPVKVLLPVVMALVSGGALQQLARRMGVPLPRAVMEMVGAGRSVRGGYDAWYGSQEGYGRRPEGQGGWLKGAMKVASTFM